MIKTNKGPPNVHTYNKKKKKNPPAVMAEGESKSKSRGGVLINQTK